MNETIVLDFPLACCKSIGDFPEDFSIEDEECALMQTSDNTNMQVGILKPDLVKLDMLNEDSLWLLFRDVGAN